jgi:hypothetical protein
MGVNQRTLICFLEPEPEMVVLHKVKKHPTLVCFDQCQNECGVCVSVK